MSKTIRRVFYLSQLKFEPVLGPLPSTLGDSGSTEQVRTAISQLHPIDAQIVRGRFGIEALPQTLDALGRELGMTRQAVAKRERRAMTRLKKLLLPELLDT